MKFVNDGDVERTASREMLHGPVRAILSAVPFLERSGCTQRKRRVKQLGGDYLAGLCGEVHLSANNEPQRYDMPAC